MERATIRDYYDRTYWDYRVVWTGRRSLACHFGYYDRPGPAFGAGHVPALLRANAQVAKLAGIGPGSRVLDAGCGLGGTALWLAAERGAEVLGIGLSERQIARARRAARDKGLEGRGRFALADYAAVPEPDESFDAVIAIESLCHAPEKAPVLAEAFRLLRPGGRLVVSDFMAAREPGTGDEARMMREWCEGWAMSPLAHPDELCAAARAAGFAEAGARDVTDHVRPSLRRLYILTFVGWPLSVLFRVTGLRNSEGHGNVVASRRQFEALRRGLWSYVHFRAEKAG